MSRKLFVMVGLMLLLSLGLAACGGGGGGTDDAVVRGKELFAQPIIGTAAGCSTCHSLEPGVVIVGPSLAGIGTTAETRVSGTSAEDYLRQSIIEPDAHLVEGFQAGTMPKEWGTILTADQLNDIVAYLLSLK